MTGKQPGYREFDFALVLSGIADDAGDEVVGALLRAGCDDSTLSFRYGRPFLTFSRAAASVKDAVLSAIRDVHNANVGANVLRVDVCELVTQADIARRTGRSRQTIHQYIHGERGPGGFPPPICHLADDSPLWYWCEVAYWLRDNDLISAEDVIEAQQIAVINSCLEFQQNKQSAPELSDEVMHVVSAGCCS